MSSRRFAVVRTVALVVLAGNTGCREGGGPGPTPASIATARAAPAMAEVASSPAIAPSFVVLDATGSAIGGVAVNVAVGEGGGTLRNAPTRTSNGPTSVGLWTLGARAGRNTLVVTVGALPPFSFVAHATPGPPADIRVSAGNHQVALAGESIAQALGVQVTDRFGNPVAQQLVRFEALSGGGSVDPATVMTDAAGYAAGVRWHLGVLRSNQTVRASLPPLAAEFSARALTEFSIEIRFPGTPPPALFLPAFENAAERIRTAVVGDLPDVAVQGLTLSGCGGNIGVTLTETIDDIIIYATVAPIDGVGKVLARAGPCFVRNGSLQSLVGSMQFDDADALSLLNSGRFESVVLHEMLHIVGIGSLWRLRNLVDSVGTSDPRDNGPIGIARCAMLGVGTQCTRGVPVENLGGSGTAGVHWRESIFDRELMTGFAESTPGMPLSVLTLGALADYGFVVNENSADPFELTTARLAPRARSLRDDARDSPWEVVLEPRFAVSPFGFVQALDMRPAQPRSP